MHIYEYYRLSKCVPAAQIKSPGEFLLRSVLNLDSDYLKLQIQYSANIISKQLLYLWQFNYTKSKCKGRYSFKKYSLYCIEIIASKVINLLKETIIAYLYLIEKNYEPSETAYFYMDFYCSVKITVFEQQLFQRLFRYVYMLP